MFAQDFRAARAVDDVGMRGIGQQLLDVGSAKCAVDLAENDEVGVVEFHRFGQAAIDAAAIAGCISLKVRAPAALARAFRAGAPRGLSPPPGASAT